MSMFLTPAEVADLTDIRTGKAGRTREQLQIEALHRMRIPFLVSAAGRPKIARATIEGSNQKSNDSGPGWEPALA
jgi:hypothetical protein